MTENVNAPQLTIFSNITNLKYSSIFPNTPTMINWHNQRCHLSHIRMQWLTDAALHLNPNLKQNPRCHDIALYAITRLDLSNNSLMAIPVEIFQLDSLRYLNVSQNKIEKLPVPVVSSPVKRSYRNSSSYKKTFKTDEPNYCCSMLEELYLQDNRLDHIPEAVFRLQSLSTLVISNNKLQHLPYSMWSSPKLKELNASHNLLKDLPCALNDVSVE